MTSYAHSCTVPPINVHFISNIYQLMFVMKWDHWSSSCQILCKSFHINSTIYHQYQIICTENCIKMKTHPTMDQYHSTVCSLQCSNLKHQYLLPHALRSVLVLWLAQWGLVYIHEEDCIGSQALSCVIFMVTHQKPQFIFLMIVQVCTQPELHPLE